MREVGLVALREVRERLRDRAFLLSNLFLLVVVLASALVPALLGGPAGEYRLGAVGERALAVAQSTQAADQLPLSVVPVAGRLAAEEALRAGDLDGVLVEPAVLLVEETDAVPTALPALLAAAGQRLDMDHALARAGVPARERTELLAPRALSVTPLVATATAPVLGPDYLLALAAVAVLYLLLMLYGQWVAQGIIEEKSSRVVELLVSSMAPRELLAGKIIGVGAIGLGQLALTAAVGLGARLALGQQLPERAPETLGLVVAWYLLGYSLYATLFAVAGALVSRVEDLQSTALPLFALIIGSFLVAQAAAQDPTSTLATVAGLVPFTAPLVQPLLMAAGVADPLTAAVAVLLCAALIVGLVPLAARAYTGGVLRIGGRVKLREAMRADR